MFESFVQKALAQDKRNCFSPYDGPVDFIPDAFQAFYRDTDPIDVEIRSGAYGSGFSPPPSFSSSRKRMR